MHVNHNPETHFLQHETLEYVTLLKHSIYMYVNKVMKHIQNVYHINACTYLPLPFNRARLAISPVSSLVAKLCKPAALSNLVFTVQYTDTVGAFTKMLRYSFKHKAE